MVATLEPKTSTSIFSNVPLEQFDFSARRANTPDNDDVVRGAQKAGGKGPPLVLLHDPWRALVKPSQHPPSAFDVPNFYSLGFYDAAERAKVHHVCAADHRVLLQAPRAVECHLVDRFSGAVIPVEADHVPQPAADGTKPGFTWIDIDIEVPKELHDIDDLRDALVELVPQLVRRNQLPPALTPELLAESLVGECRAFSPDPNIPLALQRERVFTLIADGIVITAHDGPNTFIEHRKQSQTRKRPVATSPEITPGEFYLDLYERAITINRRIIQHLDDTVVNEIKTELSTPRERLSEETVRTKIPRLSSSLDHVCRKLTEENAGFSGLLRFIEHSANPETVFGDRHVYAERILRIKQDLSELTGHIESMTSSVAQAKDSNIALLSMQGGDIAKKIAIIGATAIPLTLAFTACAIPECPVELKIPMVLASAVFSAGMLAFAQIKKWW